MQRLTARNPQTKYDHKGSYYYWMFDTERKERHKQQREKRDIVSLGFARDLLDSGDSNSRVISPLIPRSPFAFSSLFGGGPRGTCLA